MYFVKTALFLALSLSWAVDAQSSPETSSASITSASSVSTTGSTSGSATRPVSSGSVNATSSASTTSSAQFPSLSGYPSCVSNCLTVAVSSANCTSIVDVACFCGEGRSKFEDAIVDCVSTQCPTELSSTEKLSQQFCNVASSNVTLSFPTPSPSTSSTSSSSSSSSSSTAPSSVGSVTPTPSRGNTGVRKEASAGLFLSLGMSAVAAVIGAMCV